MYEKLGYGKIWGTCLNSAKLRPQKYKKKKAIYPSLDKYFEKLRSVLKEKVIFTLIKAIMKDNVTIYEA